MFQASMRCASTSATAQARACSRMRGANSARRSGVSFLESSRPTMRRLGLRITAAATTGPKRAPRPASSRPAMRIQPSWRAARSKREQHWRDIVVIVACDDTAKTRARRTDTKERRAVARLSFLQEDECDTDAILLDAGSFSLKFAEIVQAGAADFAFANDVHRADRGRVQREDALDAHAEAYAANGESGAGRAD